MEKMEAAGQNEQVAELAAIVERIFDRLEEIGAKNPDSSSDGEAHTASDDSQTEAKEETSDGSQDSSSEEDADLEKEPENGDSDFIDGDSSIPMDESRDLPDDWDEYEEAIKREAEQESIY